jgi:hypothetical protein
MPSNGDRDGLVLATSVSQYALCLLELSLESTDSGREPLSCRSDLSQAERCLLLVDEISQLAL